MKFSEAMKALEDGKQVRSCLWDQGVFITKNISFTVCSYLCMEMVLCRSGKK